MPVRMHVASLSTLSQIHWNVALAHVFSTVFICPVLYSYCGVYIAPSLHFNGRASNLVSITTALTSSFRNAVLHLLQ